MPQDEFYRSNGLKFQNELTDNKRNRVLIAASRLIVFFLAVVCIYFYIKTGNRAIAFASFGCVILFAWLVRKAVDLNDRRKFFEASLFINNNELGIIANKPNKFDDGNEFMHFDSYHYDLDVFGPASIFHLLNRTTTSHGKKALAAMLESPSLDQATILPAQEAVKTLTPQQSLVQEIIANGLAPTEARGNLADISSWIQTEDRVSKLRWVNLLRFIVPALAIASLLLYLSSDNYIPLISFVFVSWLIIGRFGSYIQAQHIVLGKKQALLEQYSSILESFSKVDTGSSALLSKMQHTAAEAHAEIRSLSRITAMFDQRMNLVVNIFLNSFLMFDIHLIVRLEKWKHKNRHSFASWIACVGEVEALISLSVYAFNNSSYVYPEIITSDKPVLKTTGLGHPLLTSNELVTNDFIPSEQTKVLLITGSNMSGKTTFLRSVGVNLLLASCGAPVCATSFQFTPMKILTSIRINDSLQEHTSYFMAELKRLSFIVSQLQMGTPSLVLIDEILRGTNSDDKTHGSAGYIRKLIAHNCISFFATHDLALSVLEQDHPAMVKNFCFESTIENNELLFDYKLRSGVAKNKNASFLMRKMGII